MPTRWKNLFVPLAVLVAGIHIDRAIARTLPLAPNLIDFNSPAGEKLLFQSRDRADYFPLSIEFVTQENPAYCGVASIVMVLNALGILAPETANPTDYRYLNQKNFWQNPKTRSIIAPEEVSRRGMTLEQMGGLLEAYSLRVRLYHGDAVTLDSFRELVAGNLREPGNFVLVNYLRSSIAQERGGHISPVAAYDRESDRFLILDVARYKYPPVWVKAEELWRAIRTIDSVSGKSRGFALISK